MIYYFSTRRNDTPIRQYLRAVWPSGVVARFVPVAYEELPRFRPKPGLYVFSDVELLDDEQRRQAAELHGRLKADPARHRVWNDPARSARRFDVLERMAKEGRNGFRAFRAGGRLPDDLRYPVFVRDENEHSGSQTPLLHNAEELRAALEELRAGARPTQPLLVVEWLDYGDANGVYRKYSMLRMGEALIRKHALFSSDWILRNPETGGRFEAPEFLAEERAFLSGGGKGDAHDAEVGAIFDTLAIDFGRIDYTVADGRIQVFEINTNPLALRPAQLEPGPRRPVHAAYAAKSEAAWLAGDPLSAVPLTRRLWWRLHRPKLGPIPWWRWFMPGWMTARNFFKLARRPAVLHARESRRTGGRVEVSACLEWCGKTHRLALSVPAWAEAWVDDSYDALTLAALPWAEKEGVPLRVRGAVSAGLLAGLRRRCWLRGKQGVEVRADTVAQPAAVRRERAVLHYTGDVFSVASAVELAEGHMLYPRPCLAVGAGAVPGGGAAGRRFLEKIGLRYADVRIDRPGPEKAGGGDVDGAARLRFLSNGFGTGYLPASAAYRYAQSEDGEPDADLDPLFSGGGMSVVHHGAQRALPATLEALRGIDALPPLAAPQTYERAPLPLVEAGLALVRPGGSFAGGWLNYERKRVRWHALDFLRWLRAEPDLAATPAGRALAATLRQGLGLSAEEAPPKAEAHRSSLGVAARPPDARRNRWWPRRAEWEGGLALISDDRSLVRKDLEPIASWLRLRNPLLPVGAERTSMLVKAMAGRGLRKPVLMLGMHPNPVSARETAESRGGRVMPKSEELAGLERAGVAVPRWRVLRPGEKLTEEEFGRYVVVKPDQGLRGAGVRVQKAASVNSAPIYVETIKTSSAPLVQEFIYTGARPVSYRVGVLFGKVIYRWRIEGREVEGRALPRDGDFRASSGVSVVSSGKGCTFSDPFDAEVIAFAEKASRAFPEIPLMGIDVVRRVPDGKLFVLELNASGYCFHLTSDTGVKMQKTTCLELPEQYGGYPYIADLYQRFYESVRTGGAGM